MVLVLPQDPAATQKVRMDPASCRLSTSALCRDPCPGSLPSPGLQTALVLWQSYFFFSNCPVRGFFGQPAPTLSSIPGLLAALGELHLGGSPRHPGMHDGAFPMWFIQRRG